MPEPRYETTTVPVDGGELRVGRWGEGDRVVLALHGITANHRSFLALAEELGGDVTLLAPDLRGRGRSGRVAGPFSMAAHADDAARILDAAGVAQALVLGHSMGGFAAVVTAHRHPDRVSRLVLVDGGIPLDLPEPMLQLPVEDLTRAIIGPALDRLSMTFASRDAHRDMWRPHPSFVDAWGRHVEDYLDYDLEGEEPELRSSVNAEAVLADAGSQLTTDDVPRALAELRHPAVLVRAEKGITGDAPLYAEGYVEAWAAEHAPDLRVETVSGVNHYTILLGGRGAGAVAELVRRELAR